VGQVRQGRADEPSVGVGEQDGESALWCELVAVLSRWPNDEAFAFEPTQVVGGLPTGVGPIEQGADEPSQGGVVEAGEQVGEPRRWRTSPPSPVVRRSAGGTCWLPQWMAGSPR
jgi:hypothetical protein